MPKDIKFGADALVYCEGDKAENIYLLQKGRVWLTYLDLETGEKTSEVVAPGEFFGAKPVLGHFPYDENAMTKEKTHILSFTPYEFEQLLMTNNRLIMEMLKIFSNQLRKVHGHLSRIINANDVEPDIGLFNIAESYMKSQRYSHARYVFSRYIELYPKNENAAVAAKHIENIDSTLMQEDQSYNYVGTVQPYEIENPIELHQLDMALLSRFSRTFKRGEMIFSEYEPGDTFYFVQSGDVRLVKNHVGYERTVDILHQSELFGEMAILDKSHRTASAMAINEVTLLEFDMENFDFMMMGHPQIAIKMMGFLSKRIHYAKRRVMLLTLTTDSKTRVADVFLMLDETGNTTNEKIDDYYREFKVTAWDIAHWAGLDIQETRDILDYYVAQRRISIESDCMAVNNIHDFYRITSSKRDRDRYT
jgi:CRP-like cAMP-binding protein